MSLSPNNTFLNESLKNIVQPPVISKIKKLGKNKGFANRRATMVNRSITTAANEPNPISILSPRAKFLLSNAYSGDSFDNRNKHMIVMNQSVGSFKPLQTSRNEDPLKRKVDTIMMKEALQTQRVMPVKQEDIRKGVVKDTYLPGIYNNK